MKNVIRNVGVALAFLFFMSACNKDETEGKSTVQVYMTDAPGDYAHIYLHVEEVAIRNNGNWIVLAQNQTDTFDILDFTNGDRLLLAGGSIDAAATDEIRLVLAESNTLVLKDGTQHELKIPSGSSSGLKIKLDRVQNLDANKTYYVVLDFNASKSIIQTGNGSYSLKPVIRGYWDEGKGAIAGFALATNYQVSVNAIVGPDTLAGTIADSLTGHFFIGGLPAGNYTLNYQATNGKSATKTGVVVLQNATTDAGTTDLN